MELRHKLAGRFIVFDGPDGGGKSTQMARLAEKLRDWQLKVTVAVDPGGTEIGNRIRRILLDYDLSKMNVRCETLLFMASRAQLVAEVINPARAAGHVVLCDRYISATCAYQGAAGHEIGQIINLGRIAVEHTWPDLTLIFNIPPDEGLKRLKRKPDAMEARSLEFHRKVHQIFCNLPSEYPGRVELIDGQGTQDEVFGRIMERLVDVDF